MRRVGGVRIWIVSALLVLLAPLPAHGQSSRAALADSARALVDDFKGREAIEVLQRALNPALGTTDAPWVDLLLLLAQVLVREGQADEASAWLRWGLRTVPALAVDSNDFPPALVTNLSEARDFVLHNPSDSTGRTLWEWSSIRSERLGELQFAVADGLGFEGIQVSVDGELVDPSTPRRLKPGSYVLTASAGGASIHSGTTEVLPGATTVVTFRSPLTLAVMSAAAEHRVRAGLVRIDATRFGEVSCGAGLVTGNEGLILTSYRSIRGADAVAVKSADRSKLVDVWIAAYDVRADLAVLTIGQTGSDSLPIAASVASSWLWAAHFPGCGDTPSLERIPAVKAGQDAGQPAGELPSPANGAVLVTATGAARWLAKGSRLTIPLAAAADLLAAARLNLAQGRLVNAATVASRERHVIGEVTLRSDRPNALARVAPLDPWQWAEAGRTEPLPFSFRGPTGRYSVEILVEGVVVASREMKIEPSRTIQLAVGLARKRRFPILIPILGGAVAGGLAALLGGGSKPAQVGGIVIRLPQ